MDLNNDRNSSKVLIVDDEKYICTAISRWLQPEGYECLLAHSYNEAVTCLKEHNFDLLISDINMPGKSGIELLRTVKEEYPQLAVLMATAVDERSVAIHSLELGAFGYMIKPFDKNEFIINVATALERRRLSIKSQEYERRLEQEVRDRTNDIRSREEEIALRLVWASEYRDDDTGEHIRRIGMFASILAQALQYPSKFVDDIRVAAPMHDVGKIGVSDNILLKPAKLTTEEFEIVKKHTIIGSEILGGSDIPLLQLASNISLSHHEKWDGSGYPQGISGKDINEAARIVAIADVYDALSYDRVYRKAFPLEAVLEIMHEGKGKHFDPEIFDCFLEVLPDFRQVQIEFSANKQKHFTKSKISENIQLP